MNYNLSDDKYINYLYSDNKNQKLQESEILKNEHNFSIDQKNFHKIYNFFDKIKKKISVNKYWNIRQDIFKYFFNFKNFTIYIKNESNLDYYKYKKKSSFFLIKFFIVIVLKKILFTLKIKNKTVEKIFKKNNSYQIFLTNEKKIKKNKLGNTLLKLNKNFPERIFWLIIAIERLSSFIIKKKKEKIYALEVGSGPCIIPGFLAEKYKVKTLIIDLPIQILIGLSILNKYFPKVKICYLQLNEILKKYKSIKNAFNHYDIIFIIPDDKKKIKEKIFSITLNNHSFQEMDEKTIKNYFNFFRKISCKENLFLNVNRKIKKIDEQDYYQFNNFPYEKQDITIYEKSMSNIYNFSKLGGGDFIIKSVQLKTR